MPSYGTPCRAVSVPCHAAPSDGVMRHGATGCHVAWRGMAQRGVVLGNGKGKGKGKYSGFHKRVKSLKVVTVKANVKVRAKANVKAK